MRNRVLAPAAVITLLVLLAGCGVSAPPPIAAPTAAPEVSPTAEPVVAPMGRLPIECDELIPESTREELLGAGATANPWLSVAGWRQGGMSQCEWVGDASRKIKVWILADAEAAYEAGMTASTGSRPSDDRTGTCGDDPENGVYTCDLSGLVDGYWYELSSATDPSVGGTPEQVGARLHSEVAASLSAAGTPLPLWQPSADAAATGTSCEPLDSPGFRAAVGAGVGVAHTPDVLVGSVIFEASRRSGELVCFWEPQGAPADGGPGYVSFQGLTGSGWSWDEVVAEWEAREGMTIPSVDVPGADAAIARCQPGHCHIEVLVDDTVFGATFQRYDEREITQETVVTAAAAWVAALGRP
jgi:hypothetical protein